MTILISTMIYCVVCCFERLTLFTHSFIMMMMRMQAQWESVYLRAVCLAQDRCFSLVHVIWSWAWVCFAHYFIALSHMRFSFTQSSSFPQLLPRWRRLASSGWDICIRFGICSVVTSPPTSWQRLCWLDWTVATLYSAVCRSQPLHCCSVLSVLLQDWCTIFSKGPHHRCHHLAALATIPFPDTFQSVSASLLTGHWKASHWATSPSCHSLSPQDTQVCISWQQRLDHSTNIIGAWRVGLQCCWCHSLEQPSNRHSDNQQHSRFQEETADFFVS